MVLVTLASGQFLMTLDSSVMNVSIATVAKDVGTTVVGIQTAITFYTLVMASLMITGGKLGQILGRKRAFMLGCVIYGCGSLTTALSPNLTVLIFGWSVLEGAGAALILPAIVALVASNFARGERPRAYGLVASAGAIAVAAGPVDRRPVHHLPVLAVGVRGRGPGGVGHPGVDPPHGRHPRRAGGPPGRGGHRVVRPGLGAGGVRHLALGDLGFRATQGGCPPVAGGVAGDLADSGWRAGAVGLLVVGGSPPRQGARRRCSTRPCCATGPCAAG